MIQTYISSIQKAFSIQKKKTTCWILNNSQQSDSRYLHFLTTAVTHSHNKDKQSQDTMHACFQPTLLTGTPFAFSSLWILSFSLS